MDNKHHDLLVKEEVVHEKLVTPSMVSLSTLTLYLPPDTVPNPWHTPIPWHTHPPPETLTHIQVLYISQLT